MVKVFKVYRHAHCQPFLGFTKSTLVGQTVWTCRGFMQGFHLKEMFAGLGVGWVRGVRMHLTFFKHKITRILLKHIWVITQSCVNRFHIAYKVGINMCIYSLSNTSSASSSCTSPQTKSNSMTVIWTTVIESQILTYRCWFSLVCNWGGIPSPPHERRVTSGCCWS